jgi:hypothetical protein
MNKIMRAQGDTDYEQIVMQRDYIFRGTDGTEAPTRCVATHDVAIGTLPGLAFAREERCYHADQITSLIILFQCKFGNQGIGCLHAFTYPHSDQTTAIYALLSLGIWAEPHYNRQQ